MQAGKVRVWFDNAGKGRGYGLIIPDLGGEDVFVHRQQLGNTYHLEPGDAVTYDLEWNSRKEKQQAIHVALVSQRSRELDAPVTTREWSDWWQHPASQGHSSGDAPVVPSEFPAGLQAEASLQTSAPLTMAEGSTQSDMVGPVAQSPMQQLESETQTDASLSRVEDKCIQVSIVPVKNHPLLKPEVPVPVTNRSATQFKSPPAVIAPHLDSIVCPAKPPSPGQVTIPVQQVADQSVVNDPVLPLECDGQTAEAPAEDSPPATVEIQLPSEVSGTVPISCPAPLPTRTGRVSVPTSGVSTPAKVCVPALHGPARESMQVVAQASETVQAKDGGVSAVGLNDSDLSVLADSATALQPGPESVPPSLWQYTIKQPHPVKSSVINPDKGCLVPSAAI